MLILLSPSKSVTDKPAPFTVETSAVLFPAQMNKLVKSLQSLSKKELGSELSISDQLAALNFERYQNWENLNAKPAVWLYSGDVYNGLDPFSLSKSDVAFTQKNLAIISGLYGIVRPFDLIKPYRLEMKLNYAGKWGDSLYELWQNPFKTYLNQTAETCILMCASKEYAKAIIAAAPSNIRIVTPRFMQETEEGLKEKGLFAKYARGALARYALDNKLLSINGLQNYTKDGFRYSKALSSETELVYIVPKDFSLKGRFTKFTKNEK